ncbi:hypothetical protein O181_068553 [Austropuccinia psidii MF-1]|uniref:Reverse transcriptase domain-containing protein n=1 Tax=Austropuccinia psidii MF-1 TaxID=1389203 RepID=A0A9Q3F0L2_9BASI|nr:hypothetical protein [Austropuccinia psidii MF-1]
MQNSFESDNFNSEKDKPFTWFLKHKDRLSALHQDMSDSMINMKILRKCVGELEHAIKCRCVETCSTADYINAMEHIITKTRIGKSWNRVPVESKMVSKTYREYKRPEIAALKCHKRGSTSHLANTFTKKEKINEAQVIGEVQCIEEKEESDLESAISEDTPVEDSPIENITAFFDITEVHTHLPQYSEEGHNLINSQNGRMCKTKPAREPLGAIKRQEVNITLNIDRPYPPVLTRQAYTATPRAREVLEKYIQELIQLGVLRKVGHNEEVEVTTPVIIAWHNDKSRMVGDFRALNTYTVPDRYPIPRIQETLTQLSKAKYKICMDALKGFHQNVLTPKTRKLLRIITHCGIYEYPRMPLGIRNAPSHYQAMINTIFPTELSEGWTIIYIDDIIIYYDSWCFHLEILARVHDKVTGVNMKTSLKKCNFGFEELEALGHIVSALSLHIDKNKVVAVLLKPIPQNKNKMISFLGFASYYRKHLKDFAILANSLYIICDQQTLVEMTQERIEAYEKMRKALTEAHLLFMPD